MATTAYLSLLFAGMLLATVAARRTPWAYRPCLVGTAIIFGAHFVAHHGIAGLFLLPFTLAGFLYLVGWFRERKGADGPRPGSEMERFRAAFRWIWYPA